METQQLTSNFDSPHLFWVADTEIMYATNFQICHPWKSHLSQLTSNFDCDDQTTLQKSASPMEAGAGQRITMTACARYFFSFSFFLHRYDAF